ncbi:hypothetical protein CI109_102557 [Kwoniella shandongensis]|uniref:Uncharacterized protein n=1 Tax=Kwoniella shandongensis TaxID=1734106 RepID=A0A5M6BWG4_9TREE|nr:uncharacterized protein CI109_005827 [Kwoniella shandongensis]KAA5525805.1 hypothetical protein CI109_005827 [Kwoniella shandongensis]
MKTSTSFAILTLLATASTSFAAPLPVPVGTNVDVNLDLDMTKSSSMASPPVRTTTTGKHDGKNGGHETNTAKNEKHLARAEGGLAGGVVGNGVDANTLQNSSSTGGISALSGVTKPLTGTASTISSTVGKSTGPLTSSGGSPLDPILKGGVTNLLGSTEGVDALSSTSSTGSQTGKTVQNTKFTPGSGSGPVVDPSSTRLLTSTTNTATGSGGVAPVVDGSGKTVSGTTGATLGSTDRTANGLNAGNSLGSAGKAVDGSTVDKTASPITKGSNANTVGNAASSITGANGGTGNTVNDVIQTTDPLTKSNSKDVLGSSGNGASKLVGTDSKTVSNTTNGLGVEKTSSGTISKDGAHVNTNDVGNTLKSSSKAQGQVTKNVNAATNNANNNGNGTVPAGASLNSVKSTTTGANRVSTKPTTDSTKNSAENSLGKGLNTVDGTTGTGGTTRPITTPAQGDIKKTDRTSSTAQTGVGKTTSNVQKTTSQQETDKTVDPLSTQVFPSGDDAHSSLLTVTHPNAQAKVLQTPGKADTLLDKDTNQATGTGAGAGGMTINNNKDQNVNVKVETPNRVKDDAVVDKSGQKVGPSDQRGNVVEEVVQGKILAKESTKSSAPPRTAAASRPTSSTTKHTNSNHTSIPATNPNSSSASLPVPAVSSTASTPHPEVFVEYKSASAAATSATLSKARSSSASASASASGSGRGGGKGGKQLHAVTTTPSASASATKSQQVQPVVSAPVVEIGLVSNGVEVKDQLPSSIRPLISSTLTHLSILPSSTATTKNLLKTVPVTSGGDGGGGGRVPQQARIAYDQRSTHVVSCDGKQHKDGDVIEECIDRDLVAQRPARTEVCPDDMQHDLQNIANTDPLHMVQSQQIAKYVRLCLTAGGL